MAKISKFDKTNVNALAKEAAEMLEKLAAKYGVSVKKGRGTYGDATFATKFEFFIPNKEVSSLVSPKFIEAFKVNCKYIGLKPEDLGKTFTVSGVEYKVAGINTRKPKNSIVLVNLTKNCLAHCSETLVKRYI